MNYSQHNEDIILKQIFNEKIDGTILEIGAFDSKKYSNSRLLIEFGWNAVLVDMSPYSLVNLINEYKNNEKILIVGGAITTKKMPPIKSWLVPRTEYTDGAVSTTSEQHKQQWVNHGFSENNYVPYIVGSICLKDLYEFLPSKIDVVSIDTEGTSTEIGINFDFNRFDVDVIIIEHDNNEEILENVLSSKYKKLCTEKENIIFIKK